jgi:hypothetical protein
MASHHRRVLTLLDPTSLLGRELAERLAEIAPGVRQSFFHTVSGEDHLIADVAGEASLVEPLVDPDELAGASVVVATRQPSKAMAARLAAWLRANPAVALVDLTEQGLAPAESTVVFDRLPAASGGRWIRLLDPSLVGAAFFLRAVASLEPEELHVTTVRPASTFGEPGIEELAVQGIARLSGRQPARPTVLPSVLAFDLAPAADASRAELERQLGGVFPRLAVRVRPLDAGVFHGHVATVGVRLRTVPGIEKLRALLRGAPALRLARRNEVRHPSDAAGSLEVTCSDVAADPPWVFATLTADGFRLTSVLLAADLVASMVDRQSAAAEPVQ